ncbi:MAG TPA: PEP-CTERM sorting domain-containing protein [Rhodocyclaceae bacterium]|nr:PEP-CTERM sorting domain-containing protein [Rhodocyclaceae bacterium]
MKRIALLALALFSLLTASGAYATVESFNGAANQHGGTIDGFSLSSNSFFHTAGRPYLENWNQAHSITAAGTFNFNSIDFSYWPWDGYGGGNKTTLHMQLLGLANNLLLDAFIVLPTDGSWVTYSNFVEDVHTISFAATGGFWPSFDNLVYNASNEVPEPGSIALFGLALAALGVSRHKRG